MLNDRQVVKDRGDWHHYQLDEQYEGQIGERLSRRIDLRSPE